MYIPFSKVQVAGNENKYLKEVLDSGWLTTSSKALKFEQEFASYVGAKYACAVNSCTSALHLAAEAIGIGEGDNILVPTMTFTASAEIVRYLGANPIFCDVDYNTCLLTPEILIDVIKKHENIKALILVHYGGLACTMHTPDENGIVDICKRNNIRLIEDAAHAFPTKYNGQSIGSFGDVTCFSFYANKTITTGEGGMMVTNDKDIYERAKVMRLHGINRDIWNRFTSSNCKWEYDVVAPGYKYNMPDINAAIGLAQLEKAEYFRNQRQRCAQLYYEELKDLNAIDLPKKPDIPEDHAWHLFPIKIKQDALVQRDEFIEVMAENGIGTSVHYKPLHRMTYYKEAYCLNKEDFPNAERIWKGTVSLPIYPDLKDSDIKFICQTIRSILSNPNKTSLEINFDYMH